LIGFIGTLVWVGFPYFFQQQGLLTTIKGEFMAKGRDTQKADKKKSEKTLKEKRKEKKEKKAQRAKI